MAEVDRIPEEAPPNKADVIPEIFSRSWMQGDISLHSVRPEFLMEEGETIEDQIAILDNRSGSGNKKNGSSPHG